MNKLDNNLESTAENLGRQISNLDVFSEYQERAEDFENDDEAQEVLAELRKVENEMRIAENKGNQEELENLRLEQSSIQEELHSLQVVKDYDDASQELEETLGDVNEHLSEALGLDFARFAAS